MAPPHINLVLQWLHVANSDSATCSRLGGATASLESKDTYTFKRALLRRVVGAPSFLSC